MQPGWQKKRILAFSDVHSDYAVTAVDASGFQFPKDKHCYVKQEQSKQTVEFILLAMLHMS